MTKKPKMFKMFRMTDNDAWNVEPDEMRYMERGYPCIILRAESTGALCGYVGVTPSNPYFGRKMDYDDDDMYENEQLGIVDIHNLEVHGGVTYARLGDKPELEHSDLAQRHGINYYKPMYNGKGELLWWIGFDCAHSGDYCPRMAFTLYQGGKPYEECKPRIFGPDHFMNETYKEIGYVRRNISMLIDQLEAAKHAD